MVQFIIIAVVSWLVGVFGWSQIIGSLQNISRQKNLIITLIIWALILSAGAYFAIVRFNALLPLLIGYGISFVQVIFSGKIQ